MKKPIPELQPDERRRLQRLFAHVLPKSYKGRFDVAYRRAVADLELFQKHNPSQRFPENSAEGFLRWVGSNDIALQFQLIDVDSTCRKASVLHDAHVLAKSVQARNAASHRIAAAS